MFKIITWKITDLFHSFYEILFDIFQNPTKSDKKYSINLYSINLLSYTDYIALFASLGIKVIDKK